MTWELNSDQFDLCNSSWPSVVNQVTKKVSYQLGCPLGTPLRADHYKLLLYEAGAMFKPQKDTEKERGMFATLVISLPSRYIGGAAITSHSKQSKAFEHESAEYFHRYISW